MLVIRLQRTGRKGHAQFRVVVQDSRRTPTSGKIVAALGSYNPHTKTSTLDKEKAAFYLEHGAQPSERVVRLLTAEGVKLPSWVVTSDKKAGKLRNPEKLRRNRPAEPEASAEAEPVEAPTEEAPAAEVSDTPAEETQPAEEAAEAPVEGSTEPAVTESETEAPAEESAAAEETPAAEEPASEPAPAEEAPAEEEPTTEAEKPTEEKA